MFQVVRFCKHVLWIVLACISAVQAAHLKLFILTGQSNSLGTTNAGESDPTPGIDPADSHIKFYWHNWADATTSLGDSGGAFTNLMQQQGGYYSGSATHWGPEINLGRTLYRAGVRNFGIIKCSRGGGGNTYWLKGSSDDHMYWHVIDAVTNACAALTAAGDTFEIAGLLYLQGESDSSSEAAAAGTRFKTLVDNLRVDLPNVTNMFGQIGGIAAAGATRDTVRANQKAIADSTSYIDYFNDLDLQTWVASDNLHFNKAAKLRIGERYAQAFFINGIVARQYGKLVFIGDSITQGGNGDHPSYRYNVFSRLARQGVPIDATNGYKFIGSVTGAYTNYPVTATNVNGQTFENVHDGHFGWRASWECARVDLPAGRYNVNNLGSGTLLSWTGQTNTFVTTDAGTRTYTGMTYTPDTAAIMIGINDLADGVAETQVCADVGTMIDQLRASNPSVRIFLNKVLHANQGATRDTQVNNLNALLPALVAAKNATSMNSPVWLMDADTGFVPVTMTYDNVHPNSTGESYVGDRIAAAMGVIETPMPTATVGPPPYIESGSGSFARKFEGHEIWNGSAYTNGWSQTGSLGKNLPSPTDLEVTNTSSGGSWIEGTATGWTNANAHGGNWTFETRFKFNSDPYGFIIWLGTGAQRILVEIYGDRTQDNGSNTFSAVHNNLGGQFHIFRIAHDSVNARYHVWRDGVRLTPLAGVAYDAAAADSRIILGDYTSGTFGNGFDVTIDYVRYDQSGDYLPTGADADADAIPDSWEFFHYNPGGTNYNAIAAAMTNCVASTDDDADGFTNLKEYIANTNPLDGASYPHISGAANAADGIFAVTLSTSSPQRNYTLWKCNELTLTNAWIPIAGPVIGTDSPLTLRDTNAVAVRGSHCVGVALP